MPMISSLLARPPGKKPIPYIYWNFRVTEPKKWDEATRNGKLRDLLCNHNIPFTQRLRPLCELESKR